MNLVYKKIQYSKGFCRNLVKSNFFIQLYFGVHLVKYTNLSMHFLNKCTYDGRFMDLPVEENKELLINSHRYKALMSCKKNRNGEKWFLNCWKLCEKFNVDWMSEFYTPEFHKYTAFIRFANKKLKKLKKFSSLYLFGE